MPGGTPITIIEEELELSPKPYKTTPSIKPIAHVRYAGPDRKAIIKQFFMGSLANLTFMVVGLGFSYPAIAIEDLTNPASPLALSYDQISWFVSIGSICVPIGCLSCGYVLDRFGRKKTMLIINSISIISWILLCTSSTTDKNALLIQILVARAVGGVSIGLGVSACSVYGSEIANKEIRGRLVAMTALNVAVGSFLAYLLGYVCLGNWRIVSGITCGLSVVALILVFIIPETPTWLASKGRIQSAEKNLRSLKGLPKNSSFLNSQLRIDLHFLKQQSGRVVSRTAANVESMWQKFRKPHVYKPLGIMVGFFFFVQTSGIMVVLVYSVQISRGTGTTVDPGICSILIGVVRVLGTIAITFTIDVWGRRILAMASGFLMALNMFGIAAYVAYGNGTVSWLPLVLLLAYFFSGTLGLLSLPLTMISEMYPLEVRGHAAGMTAAFGYVCNFVLVKVYPMMTTSMGNANVFLFYGFFSMISVVFVYFLLPETKNKSLQEIEDMFKS